MNRRTALQTFLAGLAAPLAWVRTVKAAEPCTITIPVNLDTSELREQVRKAMEEAKAMESIRPEIKGVLGKTYFKCREKPDITTARLRCYFNGADVHERTYEADAVGGWARMYDVDGVGKRLITLGLRTHYGKVEFRPV